MFDIPFFLQTDDMRAMQERWAEESRQCRYKLCRPWSPDVLWQKELNFKADTYEVRNLFPDVAPSPYDHHKALKNPKQHKLSRCGNWLYVNKRLPKGVKLSTIYGQKEGSVLFDGEVVVPCLFTKHPYRDGEWGDQPFMSMTPMELLTLRCGTRFAKGHTVVAGLGLGHQLIEVSKRKQVKKLTLVEINKQLVSMVFPRVKKFLECEVEVIVGDANEVLPKLTADVALVDIFPSYGYNKLRAECPNIGRVWCWGHG